MWKIAKEKLSEKRFYSIAIEAENNWFCKEDIMAGVSGFSPDTKFEVEEVHPDAVIDFPTRRMMFDKLKLNGDIDYRIVINDGRSFLAYPRGIGCSVDQCGRMDNISNMYDNHETCVRCTRTCRFLDAFVHHAETWQQIPMNEISGAFQVGMEKDKRYKILLNTGEIVYGYKVDQLADGASVIELDHTIPVKSIIIPFVDIASVEEFTIIESVETPIPGYGLDDCETYRPFQSGA